MTEEIYPMPFFVTLLGIDLCLPPRAITKLGFGEATEEWLVKSGIE